MEMFMMVTAVSLLGIVVTLGLFAFATGGSGAAEEQPAVRVPAAFPSLHAAATASGPPMFFIDSPADKQRPKVPIEVLLLQVERHVRLEQAAAELFLDAPTAKSLHTRTTSPLLH
jgi:hypothetical protein